MAKYKRIAKTEHYIKFHEKRFNIEEVIRELQATKNHRKRGERIVVENERSYILGYAKDNVFYIINAKRK